MSAICSNCGFPVASRPSYSGLEDFFTTSKPFSSTNFPPLEVDAQTLRQSLVQAQTHISRVDDQIYQLKTVLEDLDRERNVLQDCVDEHKAALSPARRLPPEIISELLLTSVASEQSDSLHVAGGPWRLSQVCSRWRSIALSFPALWSSVNISVDAYTTRNSLDILEMWLNRSSEYPLSVSFKYPREEPSRMQDICRDILNVLMSRSRRWRSLELSILSEDFLRLFAVRGNIPLLQRLTLHRVGSVHLQDNVHAFENAPMLHSITFRSIRDPARLMKLPWSQITYYRSRSLCTDEHTDVLRLTTNLDGCWLACDRDLASASEYRHSPVQLLELRSLCCTSLAIPPSIRTPSLEDVSVFCDNTRSRDTMDRVTDLVKRSQCTLKTLSLSVVLSRPDSIVQLMRCSPSITTLHIRVYRNAGFVNSLLEQLMVRGKSRECLLPSLARLSIQLETTSFDHYLFADMIESRWRIGGGKGWPVFQLRSVKLVDKDITAAQGSLSRLGVFKQEGLDVTIEPTWLRNTVLGY